MHLFLSMHEVGSKNVENTTGGKNNHVHTPCSYVCISMWRGGGGGKEGDWVGGKEV